LNPTPHNVASTDVVSGEDLQKAVREQLEKSQKLWDLWFRLLRGLVVAMLLLLILMVVFAPTLKFLHRFTA
jgi:hypothetical protein